VTVGNVPSVDRWRAITTRGISTSVPIATARFGAPGATRPTSSALASEIVQALIQAMRPSGWPRRSGYERARLPGLIGREAAEGGPGGEVVFFVDDADEEAQRLRGLGVEILAGPVDRPWGHRTLHLRDPDGFVVELAQEIPGERPRHD